MTSKGNLKDARENRGCGKNREQPPQIFSIFFLMRVKKGASFSGSVWKA